MEAGWLRPMSWWRAWLAGVASDCPMCGGPARGGGLCGGCHADARATMHPSQRRCQRCALRLGFAMPTCPDCARCPPAYRRVVAGCDYEAPADLLITRLKSEKRFAMAGPLAGLILDALVQAGSGAAPGCSPGTGTGSASLSGTSTGTSTTTTTKSTSTSTSTSTTTSTPSISPVGTSTPLLCPAGAVLVPVPSARASLRRRGFNPAGEIARELARATGLPLRPAWLRRVAEGPRQASLDRTARLGGAASTYACPSRLPSCPVLLVDDVMTTGATLNAAAAALLKAGASEVLCLVAMRAPAEDGGVLAQYRLP